MHDTWGSMTSSRRLRVQPSQNSADMHRALHTKGLDLLKAKASRSPRPCKFFGMKGDADKRWRCDYWHCWKELANQNEGPKVLEL